MRFRSTYTLPSFNTFCFFFFFNDTATTEIYTLSLHDALPISIVAIPMKDTPKQAGPDRQIQRTLDRTELWLAQTPQTDRKSTRLNSSHSQISYAVFCLKKKKKHKQ